MSGNAHTTQKRAISSAVLLLGALIRSHPGSAQSLDEGVLGQIFKEPVTSSAIGKPQLASEAPANIEIVTQDDIRRSGATSIPEALEFLPGVYVRRYGIAAYDVGIRGYDEAFNPRLLVLVNGREVFEQAYGHVAWPEIPVQLTEIRQIEVIKGPNSALYGFNAVGGVINIITYNPMTDPINVATLSGGTQHDASGSVVATSPLGSPMGSLVGVRLSAGGMVASDFAPGQLPPASAAVRESPKIGTVSLSASAQPTPDVKIFIEASAADVRYAEEAFALDFDTTERRTQSVRVGGSVDTRIGLLSFNAYRNEALTNITAPPNDPDLNNYEQVLYVAQANLLSKPAADHTIRFGVEYRNNHVTSPGFIAGTVGYQDYAASAMWDWQITSGLSLTNAVRVDRLDFYYNGTLIPGSGFTQADYNAAMLTATSFNTGLVYQVTDLDTLRLMVARGVQLPSLLNVGLQLPLGTFGNVIVTGNPLVRPTVVHNVELDYDRALPGWDGTIRAAVFAQRSDDVISQPLSSAIQFGPTGLPVLTTTNVGSTEALGGEINIRGHTLSGVRWNASYALVTTTDHTTLNSGPPNNTTGINFAHSVPRNIISGGIGYTWHQIELDTQARWQSSYADYRLTAPVQGGIQPVEVNNYITINARAAYQLNEHVTLALTGQQLNTSRLYQTAGPPVERRIIASLTARF